MKRTEMHGGAYLFNRFPVSLALLFEELTLQLFGDGLFLSMCSEFIFINLQTEQISSENFPIKTA